MYAAEEHVSETIFITKELTIDGGGVDALPSQFRDTIGRALHDEPAMVEQQGSQSGEFLAASSSSRTAVQTARHDVAVASMLPAYG